MSLAAAQDYRSDDVAGIVDVDVANSMAKLELTDRGMFSIEKNHRESEQKVRKSHEKWATFPFKIFSGDAYTVYFSAEKKTCKGTYQIGDNVEGQSLERCEERCDEIDNCKFYFYTNNNWCVLYSACNQTRTPGAEGSTFKKEVIDQGLNSGFSNFKWHL